MKSIPIALATFFQRPAVPRAFGVAISRTLGSALTVRGTSWDEDVTIDGDVYYTSSGGSLSDVEVTASLSVDNAELRANFDAITDADLKAGLWNGALLELIRFNPDDPTMGVLRYPTVSVGQVTVDRITWLAELRGRMQSLQSNYGWFVADSCPHTLGDEMCMVDLGEAGDSPVRFTVSGTADSVSTDGTVWTDAARTEPGPAGGVAISSITRGTTTVVVTASALGLLDGATVNFSAMNGMVLLSGPHQIRNPTGTQFELTVDTTDTGLYPNFVSGTATPLSAESGYFAYGTHTITSGANAGITREIKSYVTGQWTLQTAFPFAVTGTEKYILVAGCDKLMQTCIDKFDNVLNFLGFRVKGNDWLMQVGRQE